MKLYKQIIFILIVFFKTETLFSKNDLFNVNNIKIVKKDKISNNALANQAILEGFNQLVEKILLKDDKEKLGDVKSSMIKQLVSYYRISNTDNVESKEELVNFSITFDKDTICSDKKKRALERKTEDLMRQKKELNNKQSKLNLQLLHLS